MAKTTPLTNTEVKQAKPKDKVYKLSDGGGLQLRVKPSGTKLWLLDYFRPHTNKRTTLSLGSYPEISLKEARAKRQNAKELLANEIDPKTEREEIRTKQTDSLNNTFYAVSTNWLEIHKTKVAPKTTRDIWNSLENHIFPTLGKLPISKLKATTVIKTIKPVAAKGSLEATRKLCQRINNIMIFAVNTGVIENNPLAGINQAFKSPVVTNRPTLKPEELPQLMQKLTVANIKIVTRCLIEWQLHTMVRPSEATGAMWSEINVKNKLWLIPAERMKQKRDHQVPLTNQTLALLDFIKPISGHTEFIFPSERIPKNHVNNETANTALKRMGFKNKLVAHGLRSIASTTLNEQGFDFDVIEAALAHVDSNEVRRAYNRTDYLERRRVMMTWWSEHIQKAATGDMSLSGSTKGLTIVNK